MIKRLFKQIIIGLIFIFILSGFIFWIYHSTRPNPTCSDGIKNQGEEEIDCGGPCSPCKISLLEDLEVLLTKAIPTQENYYDLVAQIKNPNQNYGSGQIPYQFELYDNQDNLVAQSSGSTFILPNQTKYLVQMRVEGSSPVNKIKLSFGQFEWREIKDDYQPPQLVVQQKEFRLLSSEELGFSQARAILVNKSNFDFDEVSIDILLFDTDRSLLALNIAEIRTFLSGQKRDFFATWFSEVEGQVAFLEIEAETNIFDPANFLPTSKEGLEKFQEY